MLNKYLVISLIVFTFFLTGCDKKKIVTVLKDKNLTEANVAVSDNNTKVKESQNDILKIDDISKNTTTDKTKEELTSAKEVTSLDVIDNNLPQLIYRKDGSIYRTDIKSSFHQKIYTIWEDGDPILKNSIIFMDNLNKILVLINGPKLKRSEFMDVRKMNYEEHQKYTEFIRESERVKKISLINLDDNSSIDIPPSQAIQDSNKLNYKLSNDDKFLYAKETLHNNDVVYHIYDLEKKEWRLVEKENIINRCNNYLVKDPWERDGKWHIISNFDWHYTRIIEDKVVKKCFLKNESKIDLFTLDSLCPTNSSVLYLSPSAYDLNYFVYACGVNNSVATSDLGIYNISDNKKTIITSDNNPHGQASGFYEYSKYLLSPDQNKFIYTYSVDEVKKVGKTTRHNTIELKDILHILDSGEKKFFDHIKMPDDYVYLNRTFSPDSEYMILLHEVDAEDEKTMSEIATYTWQSYNITSGKINDIVTLVETTEYNNPDYEYYEKNYNTAFLGWVQ